MCFSSPSMPSPPPPPAAPPPAPQAPDAAVQAAGAGARAKVASAAGPMQLIMNIGGPAGLTTPAATTQKSTLG